MAIILKGCIQDGGIFYLDKDDYDDEEIDAIIADYSSLVKGDDDLYGAIKAREKFAQYYPGWVTITEDEE